MNHHTRVVMRQHNTTNSLKSQLINPIARRIVAKQTANRLNAIKAEIERRHRGHPPTTT